MLHDVRSALRLIRRSPGFAAIVILTIAVAVGATTTVFSIVQGLLLRPLPFADAGQLVELYDSWRNFDKGSPSLAEYRLDFEALRTARVAGWGADTGNLDGNGRPEHVLIGRATASLLPVLGVSPRLGRWFSREEEEPGRGDVVVLGPALWRRRFGANPAVIGKTVEISGVPMRIVGVLGDDLELPQSFEAWTPISFPADRLTPEARGSYRFMRAIARIAPGRSLTDLRAELAVTADRLLAAYPVPYPPDSGFHFTAVPLLDEMVGGVRQTVWMLFAAVLLVLVMACGNVGNLMLARSASRGRELAVRAALGAGRARLVRQMLVESLLLALIGGALGLVLATWGVDLVIASGPASLPRAREVRIDGAVLAFALVSAVASGLVFGLLPALTSTDVNLEEALRASGTPAAPKAGRLRRALVAADVALALVLVCGAVLLLRSFARVIAVDPGFDPSGAVALTLSVPGERDHRRAVIDAAIERLRELPGASAAGAAQIAPLSGEQEDRAFDVEGHEIPPGVYPPSEEMRIVTPGWFEAMGVRVVRGRTLRETDRASVVINDAFARRYFPGVDPVGRRLRRNGDTDWWTVVGVVSDVREFGLHQSAPPIFYLPFDAFPRSTMTLVLRSSLPAKDAIREAERAVGSVDPALPAYRTGPVTAAIAASLSQRAFTVDVLQGFAVLSLLLAGLGLYGVLAYSVSQRTREMGVRMALGARPAQAVALVARETARMVAAGLAFGCAGALVSARVFAGLLFGVGPSDPLSLAASIATLAAVAAVATLVPASRAARVDPAVALRAE